MMETKDFISFVIGALLFAFGLLPILSMLGYGPEWFDFGIKTSLFAYIVAIAGFYLIIESFIEITNSNSIGWWSFLIAAVLMTVGILQVLASFSIGPTWFNFNIPEIAYYMIFMIEGLFLMIAMFAMEL